MASTNPDAPGPLFIADNVALDFINTEYGEGARHCDCFVDDKSVVDWLKSAGLLSQDFGHPPKGLLAVARALRQSAKALVGAAKSGSGLDTSVVNQVLEMGRPLKELQWDSATNTFKVVRRRRTDDGPCLLEPVAEAVASLLTTAHLELVRQCEGDGCTLLFHDLTKSHRRRWCSMAACGNRMKVAAFRSRKTAE